MNLSVDQYAGSRKTGGEADEIYQKALAEARRDEKDVALVVQLLEEAVKLGSPEAHYALAMWLLDGVFLPKDMRRAIDLMKVAAKAGVPFALHNLAVSYEKGEGGLRASPKRAARLYLKAAFAATSRQSASSDGAIIMGSVLPRIGRWPRFGTLERENAE